MKKLQNILIISCIPVGLIGLYLLIYSSNTNEENASIITLIMGSIFLLTPFLYLAVHLAKIIVKRQSKLDKIVLTILATLILAIPLALIKKDYRIGGLPDRIICGTNLSGLAKAIVIYANKNQDLFPDPNNWCDLLLQETTVERKQFKCPNDKKGPCSFAINPRAKMLSPSDVVLLFESETGWNKAGGPELLTTKNHKGEGANILFSDFHVEFVEKKDFNDLNWGDEP